MKRHIYILLFLLPFVGKAQQDTLEISSWELSDSIYGNLGIHVNTGFLLNRTLLDTSQAFVYNTDRKSEYTSNADLYYRLMKELKMMALDTSVIPDFYTLMQVHLRLNMNLMKIVPFIQLESLILNTII
jgi:hypothetical protein